MKRKNERVNRS